jgi:DNA-binding GntR family transcriptional regulator
MRVKVWTADEMFDLYELRIILESGAARWAAERKTRLDVIRLRQTNEEMRKLDPAVADNLRDANLAFHEALWRASHNDPLIDTLGRLQRQIMRHPASTLKHPGRWAAIIQEHDRLIEAIERGDGEQAENIAGEHMTEARDLRLANYLADQDAPNQA